MTVLGAGIAGLASAFSLSRRGRTVTVIDQADRPGGKLRTSVFAGRPVDEGADAFLLRVPWAVDLCRQLGIDEELVHPAERSAYVFSDEALHRLPPQLMGVPTDESAFAPGALLAGTDTGGRDDTPLTGPDVTVAEEIERRVGPEVLARLVDPLVGGINAGDTRALSLASVVPQLDAAARDTQHARLIDACRAQLRRARDNGVGPAAPIFATLPGGMERLVDALVAAMPEVHFQLGTTVESLADLPGDTVLALPAFAAARLLAQTPARVAAQHLTRVEHASVALVTLAVQPEDVDRSLDASGFLVARTEAATITACSWASRKWSHLGPERGDGTVVLRASVGRHRDRQALDLDDAALTECVVDDLARTMGLRGAPTEARVTRWDDGFPQYAPGHQARMSAVHADLAAHLPRVAVAGAALAGVGIPACIRSGTEAADRLLAAR